jgi:lipoprotein-releasing system ATP-binding protein
LVEDLLLNLVDEHKVSLMLITHNNAFASRCNIVYHLHDKKLEVNA